MMNKKQLIVAWVVIILFLPFSIGYASAPKPPYLSQNKITDQQLKDLAIEKMFIPYNYDKAYYESQLAQKHTVSIWIIAERSQKIEIIDALKKMFLEKEDTVIEFPSSYYVDEINGVIYNSLESGDYFGDLRKGIGIMFKTIAIMEGDFDNGKSLVETLKKHCGRELFEFFKKNYPDKYEKLVKTDNERNK